MATVTDFHSPSFVPFPINNSRTAWRPISFPIILVAPHRESSNSIPINNSGVFNVRIYIESVPQEARVAGHQHIGQRFPDRELYAINIGELELADRILTLNDLTITRNDEIVELTNAKQGDLIHYITSTGIRDTITYLPGTNYYDLSDIKIEVELLPSDIYNLVYQAEYYTRIISKELPTEFLCIDTSSVSVSLFKFQINHPGDVIDEMYRLTPEVDLTNSSKAKDTTVDFYRPFSDILQDIMDEQDLLKSFNWVYNVQPEVIPYLSALLGWELPYFPLSLDKFRKAVLRRTVEFQKLKGSHRALVELFRLFNFEILITNLWWSVDGKRFIRPGEILPEPYKNQEIKIEERCQTDIILDNWTDGGFGIFEIPLLYRPQELSDLNNFQALREGGNISIDTYIVTKDSEAWQALTNISAKIKADPANYGNIVGCTSDANDFVNPTEIHNTLANLEISGYSQILISGKLGDVSDAVLVGPIIPVVQSGCLFDRTTNVLSLTLNGYIDTTDVAIFSFVTYKRQEIVVPELLTDLQSNRFDIQILTIDTDEFANPQTLEFAIEFLYKVKAFHSLLNVIDQKIELTEGYLVTDYCVGGDIIMRYDTDAGRFQVPPAIIPKIPLDLNNCAALDPESLGYKRSDIVYRIRVLTALAEEHAAWKSLDDTVYQVGPSRLAPQSPSNRDGCKFNPNGQDRVVSDPVTLVTTEFHPTPNTNQSAGTIGVDYSPITTVSQGQFNGSGSSNSDSSPYGPITREYTDIRKAQCDLDGNDYCYQGRVHDEILYRSTLLLEETVKLKPCSISLGTGQYWLYPEKSTQIVFGVSKLSNKSLTPKSKFSGGATGINQRIYRTGKQAEYFDVSLDVPLPEYNDSVLGTLYRNYLSNSSYTLHYSNRLLISQTSQEYQLALQRPSLNIEKPNLHFPGCRFIRLNALQSTFISPDWRAKPWDDQYSTYCGPTGNPTFLNAAIVNGYLVYDDIAFIVPGNNLTPDFVSLGDQTVGTGLGFTANDVVHSIYDRQAANAHPAITEDDVCPFGTDVNNGFIEIDEPIFSSARECGTNYIDFADGYPCLYGVQPTPDEDLDRGGLYAELMAALGLAESGLTSATFFLRSGIRVESGLRLDCGCLVADCNETTDSSLACISDKFLDENGEYYWDLDQLSIERNMVLEESVGVSSFMLNGEIPTLLETW